MAFLDDRYLLDSEYAVAIYTSVKNLPIIDPHNHADVAEIAGNQCYANPWQVFAATDHYVWEVERKRGVAERFITGNASPLEKWNELARVMPEIAGNPVYEWIHLDMKRRFGIEEELSSSTADSIWNTISAALATDAFRPQALLKKMNVEVMCSTDDPVDTLEYHDAIRSAFGKQIVRPTWRPDKAVRIHFPGWKEYMNKLGDRFGMTIRSVKNLIEALQKSHDYFAEKGCRVSDHDTPAPVPDIATESDAEAVFQKAMRGETLTKDEIAAYTDYVTIQVAEMDAAAGWVYQMHIGVVRNVRDTLFKSLGPDVGGDVSEFSIDIVKPLCGFLNHFDDRLKVVLYCLEPCHEASLAAIARAFGAKVRLGSAWWLNDTPFGMAEQLKHNANVDLLANFAGMVSDSRKILSYASRFEMFRRVLASELAHMVNRGRMSYAAAENLAVMMCYSEPKKFFNI